MSERTDLMRDGLYFCEVLLRKLTRLEQLEPDGRLRSHWQQATGMLRRIRGELRNRIDNDRQRVKREALAREGRWPGHG